MNTKVKKRNVFAVNLPVGEVLIRSSSINMCYMADGLTIKVQPTVDKLFHVAIIALVAKAHQDKGNLEWVRASEVMADARALVMKLCKVPPRIYKDPYATIRTMWFDVDRGLRLRSGYEGYSKGQLIHLTSMPEALQTILGNLLCAKGTSPQLLLRIDLSQFDMDSQCIDVSQTGTLPTASSSARSFDNLYGRFATQLSRGHTCKQSSDGAIRSLRKTVDALLRIVLTEGYNLAQLHILGELMDHGMFSMAIDHISELVRSDSLLSKTQAGIVRLLIRAVHEADPVTRRQAVHCVEDPKLRFFSWRTDRLITWWHAQQQSLRRKKILYYGNNETTSESLNYMLTLDGFCNVSIVSSSNTILAAIRSAKPDLIITDMIESTAGGQQMAEAVHHLPGMKSTPVILVAHGLDLKGRDLSHFAASFDDPLDNHGIPLMTVIEALLADKYPD